MILNNDVQKQDVLRLIRKEGYQIIDKLSSLGLDTVPKNEEDLDAKSLDHRKYGKYVYLKGTKILPDIFLHYGLLNEKNYITDVVIVVKNSRGDKFLFCIEDYTDEEKEYQVIRKIQSGNNGKIHLLAESFKKHDKLNEIVRECWEDLANITPVTEGFVSPPFEFDGPTYESGNPLPNIKHELQFLTNKNIKRFISTANLKISKLGRLAIMNMISNKRTYYLYKTVNNEEFLLTAGSFINRLEPVHLWLMDDDGESLYNINLTQYDNNDNLIANHDVIEKLVHPSKGDTVRFYKYYGKEGLKGWCTQGFNSEVITEAFVDVVKGQFKLDYIEAPTAKEAFDKANYEDRVNNLILLFIILANNKTKPGTTKHFENYRELEREFIRELNLVRRDNFKFNLIQSIINSKYYSLLQNCLNDDCCYVEEMNRIYSDLIFKYR